MGLHKQAQFVHILILTERLCFAEVEVSEPKKLKLNREKGHQTRMTLIPTNF